MVIVNTLRPEQIFVDCISKYISLVDMFCVFIQIQLKFVARSPFDSKSALVQVVALALVTITSTNGDQNFDTI